MSEMKSNNCTGLHQRYIYRGYLQTACVDLSSPAPLTPTCGSSPGMLRSMPDIKRISKIAPCSFVSCGRLHLSANGMMTRKKNGNKKQRRYLTLTLIKLDTNVSWKTVRKTKNAKNTRLSFLLSI